MVGIFEKALKNDHQIVGYGDLRPQDQKSVASVIAKEALHHPSSFKSDLRCVVSPREEKNPPLNAKLLLSALIKA